jgi:hypothetical protein
MYEKSAPDGFMKKISQNEAQPVFCRNEYVTITLANVQATSAIKKSF